MFGGTEKFDKLNTPNLIHKETEAVSGGKERPALGLEDCSVGGWGRGTGFQMAWIKSLERGPAIIT